jgi:uncharacterized protein YjgD (DUF1641 family)
MPANENKIILEKLESIEAELLEMRQKRQGLEELQEDLTPLMKQAFRIMLREMGEVEHGFQLEDSFHLAKRFLRNVNNIAYTLDQLENVIELFHTVEPLLKGAVNHGIFELGRLEQKGVFRTYAAMLEVRGKVAQEYGPEEIEAMGDSFVAMLGLLKKMSDPKFIEFLDTMMDVPANVDLSEAKPMGPMGAMSAMKDPDVKRGLGIALQMAKALGKANEN